MWKNILTNYFLWIILFIIIIGIIIFYWGRKTAKNIPPVVNYPHNGADIPLNFDASILATDLHEAMKGVSLPSTNPFGRDKIFVDYLNLDTDEMFIAVYDTFNKLYMQEEKGTLRQWLQDEFYMWGTDFIRPKIYARMDKLNLK